MSSAGELRWRVLLLWMTLTPGSLLAQDDVADIPSQELRAGKQEQQRYFLIGPMPDATPPKDGYGLVVILPGGDGSAEFHPFVQRIYKYAIPEGYLAAQPVAVKWTDEQQVVWPTAKSPTEGMKFTTEQLVAAVIADVAAKHKLDSKRIFTLSWSSSGPVAYAISLADKSVRGSLIAMSVYQPQELAPLARAKDRAFFLYHSPDDDVCPFWMAKEAAQELEKHGAKTKLVTYDGGHGWRGPLYQDIRQGIEWLEENTTTAKSGSR